MAKIRVFEAAGEGFRLIRREPKTILAWSAALFVVLGVPSVLLMQQLAPLFGATDATGVPQIGAAVGLAPLIWLLTLLAYIVAAGAVFRAVISPEDRRFQYVRLGKAELWMALSAIVGAILGYIAMVVTLVGVVLLVGVPVGMMFSSDNPSGSVAAALIMVPAMLAAYVGGGYLALRFSMAPLMSFHERRFRLFESWAFTRGEGWRLLGLAVLMTVALVAVELVIFGVVFASLGSSFWTALSDPAGAEQLASRMMAFYSSPWLWPVAVVGGVLGGAVLALLYAPWARAYAMLRETVEQQVDAF